MPRFHVVPGYTYECAGGWVRGKRAVRLQFATRRQLLWGRKWDVELWRLDDAREAKEKKERIIIKSERNGFIFDRQFAGIWMYA